MREVAKVFLWAMVGGAYLYVLLGFVKKFERRRLTVAGEAGDSGEDRVFLFIVLFAFVGTLWVLGE